MRRPFRPLLLVPALLALLGTVAGAVGTRTFRITSWKDFDEGESDGALLSSLGEVVAGQGAKRVEVAAAQLFASTTAPDGTVYLGAGDQPDVFAWDGKSIRTVCRLEGVLVTALAAAPDGTVYAATPDWTQYTVRDVARRGDKWAHWQGKPTDNRILAMFGGTHTDYWRTDPYDPSGETIAVAGNTTYMLVP